MPEARAYYAAPVPVPVSVSVVIPVYRGAATVGELVEALGRELRDDHALEVVLVDDASPDDSAAVCEALAKEHDWVRFIGLARNVGEHSAVLAGLHHASGELVVIMDDDLQHPPEEVRTLIAALGDEHDVVYGRYHQKRHGLLANLGSRFNGWVAKHVLDKPEGLYLSSFKVMRRFVVDELCKVRDPAPYLDGYILGITRHLTEVSVAHHPRRHGTSNYTLRKLVSLWMRHVVGFSLAPLRAASLLGLLLSLTGLVAAAVFVIERLRDPSLPAGWASVIVSVTLLGGVQLFTLGMLGEYLGRVVQRTAGAPAFVVRRTVGTSADRRGGATAPHARAAR